MPLSTTAFLLSTILSLGATETSEDQQCGTTLRTVFISWSESREDLIPEQIIAYWESLKTRDSKIRITEAQTSWSAHATFRHTETAHSSPRWSLSLILAHKKGDNLAEKSITLSEASFKEPLTKLTDWIYNHLRTGNLIITTNEDETALLNINCTSIELNGPINTIKAPIGTYKIKLTSWGEEISRTVTINHGENSLKVKFKNKLKKVDSHTIIINLDLLNSYTQAINIFSPSILYEYNIPTSSYISLGIGVLFHNYTIRFEHKSIILNKRLPPTSINYSVFSAAPRISILWHILSPWLIPGIDLSLGLSTIWTKTHDTYSFGGTLASGVFLLSRTLAPLSILLRTGFRGAIHPYTSTPARTLIAGGTEGTIDSSIILGFSISLGIGTSF